MGLAEDILKPQDFAPVPFPCAWAREGLYIKRWSGNEAATWHTYSANQRDDRGLPLHPHTFRAKLIQLALCDKDGKLVFAADDVPKISALRNDDLEMAFDAVCQVNCIGALQVAQARELFLRTLTKRTGSDSPSNANSPTPTT